MRDSVQVEFGRPISGPQIHHLTRTAAQFFIRGTYRLDGLNVGIGMGQAGSNSADHVVVLPVMNGFEKDTIHYTVVVASCFWLEGTACHPILPTNDDYRHAREAFAKRLKEAASKL